MESKAAYYPSPFGTMRLVYEDKQLLRLDIVEDEFVTDNAPTRFTDTVNKQMQEYFAGKRKSFQVEFSLEGTEFQKKVWQALQAIPYGETRSYGQIAEAIGNPKASRAVGMANNRNPVSIIVPCHRVIGANGSLVGYGGGLEMKQALLDLEKENV